MKLPFCRYNARNLRQYWRGREIGLGSLDRQVLWLILESAQDKRQISIREIMELIGLSSPNHVVRSLNRLVERDLVKKESKLGRTIRPTCRVEFFGPVSGTSIGEAVAKKEA